MLPLPRLVVAAPQGRSGKTTVSLGICAALRGRGLAVQAYKKGPDYIDPSWLGEAAGRACRSLDPFFYEDPASLLRAFVPSAKHAELSLIEGNHGLFDSYDDSGTGSTAALARALGAPVLLVINAARIGRSAAAIVYGCQTFEAGVNIAGVVLNQVAQGRHETRIRTAIESYCHVPVIGALPRDASLSIPDRHLGLIPRAEGERFAAAIDACKRATEKYLDVDEIVRIANAAPRLDVPGGKEIPLSRVPGASCRIGIFRDKAFTFYYPENLEALEEAGAELCFVNALEDTDLPQVDALYMGGGFPEIFMEELSANGALLQAVRESAERGLPIYAECGGMMYLSRRIVWGDKSAWMAGVLPCEIEMTDRPEGHGYVIAEVDQTNPFFAPGTTLRGHEFHNSRLVGVTASNSASGPLATAYRLSRGNGLGNGRDGILVHNVLASYTHLHAGGAADWAKGLVRRAQLFAAAERQR
ncbi:MAG: cobyrinate a,c-diamide synthase [Bacteroidota bacterium]